MKQKKVAAVLAFLLGIWGVHRFYLGQRFRGFLHLGLFFVMMVATIEEGFPFIFIPAIIGFIDAVLLGVMPKEEFDDKYNLNKKWNRADYDRRDYAHSYYKNPSKIRSRHPYKSYGIEYYKQGQYEEAKSEFQKALGIEYEDPITHFNLACCYSQMEEPGKSIFHLRKAIEYGYDDFDKIHRHEGLAALREEEIFEDFVENGYRLAPPSVEVSSSHSANKENELSLDVLEQINQLGKLKELGLLTEEEFIKQKKKILS